MAEEVLLNIDITIRAGGGFGVRMSEGHYGSYPFLYEQNKDPIPRQKVTTKQLDNVVADIKPAMMHFFKVLEHLQKNPEDIPKMALEAHKEVDLYEHLIAKKLLTEE